MPAVLDRKGTRWMLQALSPAPLIVLVHRGRKSGRVYKTPVQIVAEDLERTEIVISPLWGRDSDWYRNVVAGGLVEVHFRGQAWQVEWQELGEAERRAAMDAYRAVHPIHSRMILRLLVGANRLKDNAEQAVLRDLPMLRLRRTGFTTNARE
jgi:deazaflavin-dependent oxidoreductase (nitroreductase family)